MQRFSVKEANNSRSLGNLILNSYTFRFDNWKTQLPGIFFPFPLFLWVCWVCFSHVNFDPCIKALQCNARRVCSCRQNYLGLFIIFATQKFFNFLVFYFFIIRWEHSFFHVSPYFKKKTPIRVFKIWWFKSWTVGNSRNSPSNSSKFW